MEWLLAEQLHLRVCGVGGLPPATPRRSKMGLLDVCVRGRCLFPWSARSECRNATHTRLARGLRCVNWPRSVDRDALTYLWLVPSRHGGMIRPTLTGAAQDRAPGKQRLRQACKRDFRAY